MWYQDPDGDVKDTESNDDDDETRIVTPQQLADSVGTVYTKRRLRNEKAFGLEESPEFKDEFETVISTALDVALRLDSYQRHVAHAAVLGNSGLITGSAGTGKSHLVRCIQQLLELCTKNVVLTSTTGIAAENLGPAAMTIHSYAMIGRCDRSKEAQARISRSKKSRARWCDTDTLIIDECSMLSKKGFELTNVAAKNGKNKMSPFGGVQLILVGDFYQLPPVGDDDEDSKQLCFESSIWPEIVKNIWVLSQSHRQQNRDFFSLLSRIRVGSYSAQDITTLQSFTCTEIPDGIIPTKLFSKRSDVDKINSEALNLIDEPAQPFIGTFSATIQTYSSITGGYVSKPEPGVTDARSIVLPARGKRPESTISVLAPESAEIDRAFESLIYSTRTQKSIVLKKGAQVIFEQNDSTLGVRNGSRGVVTGFTATGLPEVTLMSGDIIVVQRKPFSFCYKVDNKKRHCVEMLQIPLSLAWSLTIHKSQSQSLDCMEAHLDGVFEAHQVYVALSRACNPKGLLVKNLNPDTIRILPKVAEFYNSLKK